ncbi:NADP-dependent isocitrate dehydrogenase [Nannocystaceae bacterium ST9]
MLDHPSSRLTSSTTLETIPTVALAEGDGIGPEIVSACLRVLEAAGARLDLRTLVVGERAYRAGANSGISEAGWATLRECSVMLKGPITTPQGGGYKSVNVSLRKKLGLFANVRPCVAYHPFVPTRFPALDVVVVRENEEDTYGGIEHRQTAEVYQCLKLMTRPGCERVVRYAFEYARAHDRHRVTCLTKDNIMKLTDGLFRQVFEQIAHEYPELAATHEIIDIGTARLATRPERYDVLVLPNLYGDIVSDVLAELAGSVGMAASANLGEHFAMFEAVHGSAPDIAGRDLANPSGVLLAAVMMLGHVGQPEVGTRIQDAWLRTLEDGIATPDMFDGQPNQRRVGTREFAEAIVANLGERPRILRGGRVGASTRVRAQPHSPAPAKPSKRLVGVDVFLDWDEAERSPEQLAHRVRQAAPPTFELEMISNRGTVVWPGERALTWCADHWRCRFRPIERVRELDPRELIELFDALVGSELPPIKTENLYTFDGRPGYSLGQGQ